ncbi:MAG TPA: hypothetical protein VL463_07630 [Kofleriaceae bacterium]|nr:hypothetical protein [Kofleriaceae bacterium]
MRAAVVAVFTLFGPSLAFAGGNQDTAVTQLEYGREHDAASDRAYLSPTAITPREGTWTLSLRQPTLPLSYLTAGYAVSDRVMITAGLAVPLGENATTLGSASVEIQLASSDDAALALQTGVYGTRDGTMTYATLVGTACWSERECAATATAYVTASLAPGADRVALTGGGSIGIGGSSVRFLLEADVVDDQDYTPGYLGMIGLRFPGARWTIDAGAGGLVSPEAEFAAPALLFDASVRM